MRRHDDMDVLRGQTPSSERWNDEVDVLSNTYFHECVQTLGTEVYESVVGPVKQGFLSLRPGAEGGG